MPRKGATQNLTPFKKGDPRTIAISKMGGEATKRKKQEYRDMTEAFQKCIDDETREQLFKILVQRAKEGNVKAFEVLRDTLGEKPVEKIEQTNVNVSVQFEEE